MRLFAIDNETNNITAFPAAEQVPEGQLHFASESELANLASDWNTDRLVEIWNSFAGVAAFGTDLKPVKKFTDRRTGVKRIWSAIQKLDGAGPENATAETPGAETPAKGPKPAKGARKAAKAAPKQAKAPRATKAAKTANAAPATREGSKKATVIALLSRRTGATLSEIMEQTGWMAHSVRGFISGNIQKKMGFAVESSKNSAGERCYKITK